MSLSLSLSCRWLFDQLLDIRRRQRLSRDQLGRLLARLRDVAMMHFAPMTCAPYAYALCRICFGTLADSREGTKELRKRKILGKNRFAIFSQIGKLASSVD